MKKLPVSTSSFKDIVEENNLYIDKTKWIYDLLTQNKFYFLSRPRRFGKSLTLSALKEIFEGNKELFKGLYIYEQDYKWDKYPIIRINFSEQKSESKEELKNFIISKMDDCGKLYGLSLEKKTYTDRFQELIVKLRAINKVVILIDEYDKPIIDNLENPTFAIELREILKGFYTIIKAADEYLRFAFVTGVSKFAKTGIFSGLNNLVDLTMEIEYSSMLGITEYELVKYFEEYIKEFAKKEEIGEGELLEKIREWYNGFCFSKSCERVYNPYSTMLLFRKKDFSNYWFDSGTPTFLVKLLKEKEYDLTSIDEQVVDESAFSSYEIEDLDITALLFQTGYLTIKGYNKLREEYVLGYPNREVRVSFNQKLLIEYSGVKRSVRIGLLDSLREKDFDKFFKDLRLFFIEVPCSLHIKLEKYYQTIFYLIFKIMGADIGVEEETNIGRLDAVIEDKASIFVFEFKLNGTKEDAMKQIKEKRYYEKYVGLNKQIYLIGVEFRDRNIGDWLVEELKAKRQSKDIT